MHLYSATTNGTVVSHARHTGFRVAEVEWIINKQTVFHLDLYYELLKAECR